MTDTAWQKISPADREKILEVARLAEKQIGDQAPGLDAKSIDEMKKTGVLKPVALEPRTRPSSRATVDKATISQPRAPPADVFDLAVRSGRLSEAKESERASRPHARPASRALRGCRRHAGGRWASWSCPSPKWC